jgi:hypothetical protein
MAMDPRGPRFQYHSFTVPVGGGRSVEDCRRTSHWKGRKNRCVFCDTQLDEDGSEVAPPTDE